MIEALNACPFCGCGGCGALGPDGRGPKEAIAGWNTRAPGWLPIETAPRDGAPFLATLTVRHMNGSSWRETHLIWANDTTGTIDVECERGWEIDDYEFWQPLPPPPNTSEVEA